MRHQVSRRDFLATTAAATAGVGLVGSMSGEASATEWKTKLRKSLIRNPNAKAFEALKAAGFEGVETQAWSVDPSKAEAGRKISDDTGVPIQSVMRGWANFNNSDPAAVDKDIKSVELALTNAEIYGAGAVLLVPCRMGAKAPKPWEFDIDFDEKTCIVSKVVAGDNTPYAEYIKAQNLATEMSKKAIERLIPTAEKTGVTIAIENVWNNLWVKPKLFAAFVRMFDSPAVKAYFDIGNHVKYADPCEWLEALGDQIVRLHVKDFAIDREKGSGGSFKNIREGDVDWPRVRKTIDKIGYNGWMTIEGSGGLSLEELDKRLSLIIDGK